MSLFDASREATHRTDVTVTIVHRFAIGETIVDVAGGEWRVLEVGYGTGPWYALEALNDVAVTEVRGSHADRNTHHGSKWVRREALRTIDRHFNPKP